MAGRKTSTYSTMLEAVRDSLADSSRYNASDAAPPAAILWTDADGQWGPVVALLRKLMPELLTLGDYNQEERTGPAIWLRCVIERVLSEPEIPDDVVPAIYVPNVSRQLLRAVEECPILLQPLVELQYRGVVWTQRNGKDWTVEAFLVSEDGGLELDVARDHQTRQAMLGALTRLVVTPLLHLRGKRLEAEDFDKLMIEDTPRELLTWLSNPRMIREERDGASWDAFQSRCKAEYGFDPESDGEIVGGEKLGTREGSWLPVWLRFKESPSLYPGIPELLRRSKPSVLIFDKEPWPDENDNAEESLRNELLALESVSPQIARNRIISLEDDHGQRRGWIWAKMGESPLATALEHLVVLAKHTSNALGGDTPEAMAKLYTKDGYLADDAVIRSISCVKTDQDHRAVEKAVRSIYLPWLDDAARHFQQLVASNPLPTVKDEVRQVENIDSGICLLFADGLRFDLAQRLIAMAEECQLRVVQNWRWSAVPTVTSTAKPAVSPVAGKLVGHSPGEDFYPEISESQQMLTPDRFRKLLVESQYQFISETEIGSGIEDTVVWTEYGEFDSLGHKLQSKLAVMIEEQLELLLDRIQVLLEAGWREVRVVTDHGWLLMPGGLPKVQLPKYLTESRWTRCAVIKDESHVKVPVYAWYWNPNERFAFGPGIACFVKGSEFAHGGLSLQECVIPELSFSWSMEKRPVSIKITDVQWIGMRCRTVIKPCQEGVIADIRTKPNDPNTSIAVPKEFDDNGRASLLVADDSFEGTAVNLVVLDKSGRIISKQPTTVGGED